MGSGEFSRNKSAYQCAESMSKKGHDKVLYLKPVNIFF